MYRVLALLVLPLALLAGCGGEGGSAGDIARGAAEDVARDAAAEHLPSADDAARVICQQYADKLTSAVTDDAKAALADLEKTLADAATVANMTAEAESLTVLSEAHADPAAHTQAEITAAEATISQKCADVDTPLP